MCYSVQALLKAQLKRAQRSLDEQLILEIEEKLAPYLDSDYYHASGFAFPQMLIYTNDSTDYPVVARWGLVPHWVKDNAQMKSIRMKTLNARGETIFSKPSFRLSANEKRCLLFVNGFYEFHHFNGKAYPFFIYKPDKEPMAIAGIWSDWVDKETGEIVKTFSIVTHVGNDLLAKIHNNPKLKGPRMPMLLPENLENDWLNPDVLNTQEKLLDFIQKIPNQELSYHPVNALSGKSYLGDVPEVSQEKEYPELVFNP